MTTAGTVLVISIIIAGGAQPARAQTGPPAWFQRHMAGLVGRWVADNSPYRSGQEPADAYGLEWTWSVGRHTIEGRLFSLSGGRETGTHWEFRVFWHPGQGRAVVQQFGANGVIGLGAITPVDSITTELVQDFFAPDGSSNRRRHLQREDGATLHTASFAWVDGSWQARRSYLWRRSP